MNIHWINIPLCLLHSISFTPWFNLTYQFSIFNLNTQSSIFFQESMHCTRLGDFVTKASDLLTGVNKLSQVLICFNFDVAQYFSSIWSAFNSYRNEDVPIFFLSNSIHLSFSSSINISFSYSINHWKCNTMIKEYYRNCNWIISALYMTFFTIPMMLTCACIVFCNLLVMAKIIKMKIKPDPNFKLSEQNTTTQVINLLFL